MALKIKNTLTGKTLPFKPINPKQATLFVCGPTVYDFSHIGHARTYIFFDVVAKYLQFKKYKVKYIVNITDIDDKIIKRAAEEKRNPLDLAREFQQHFLEDMRALNITSVSKYTPATSYIPAIINQIKTLEKKGYTYKIENDGIYYNVSKFKEYGKLSGRTALRAEDATSRIDESVSKRNKADFCLWKFQKPNEPFWDSPWGKGRPGWHIEDTAITETEFGPQYDIHGGAVELAFPHHEAEIAQMEAASGKSPLVRYWMHTGLLNIKGEKMSKSLKNFITIRDALKQTKPEALHFFALSTHYRKPIDYSDEAIEGATNSTQKLSNIIFELQNIKSNKSKIRNFQKKISAFEKKFTSHMDNDFNTPLAITSIFDFTKYLNKNLTKINKAQAKTSILTLTKYANLLGILPKTETKALPKELKQLIEKREQLRAQKRFSEADEIREQLKQKGILLDDTPEGVHWRFA